MAEYNAAGELMPVESSGWINWPTDLEDSNEGGMTVLAFVPCDDAPPTAPPFAKCYESGAPVRCVLSNSVPIDDVVGVAEGFLAVVELGSTSGSFYRKDVGEYWHCTRADLTPDGAAIVAMLEKLYGRAVEIRTFLDT